MERSSFLKKTITQILSEAFDIKTDIGMQRLEQIVERSETGTVLENLMEFLPDGTTKEEVIGKIEEALARVKRKWTETHPAVNIDPNAILRNKIVKFIGDKEKCRCTRTEFNDFCNSLQEDEQIGRIPSRSWLPKNKHIVKKIKVGNTPYLKLTPIGKRVHSYICKEEKEDVNESKMNLNLPVKWDRLDDYRENERIGGIEFRPPVHNASDAPPAAVDVPAGGVGEAAELTDDDKEILKQVDTMDRKKYSELEQGIIDRGVSAEVIRDYHRSLDESVVFDEEEQKRFDDWVADGNAEKVGDDEWIEQTTQWKRKFSTEELKEFFKKEFISEMVEEENSLESDDNQLVDPVLLDAALNDHFGEGDADFSFVIDRMLVKVQSTNNLTPPETIELPDGAVLTYKSRSEDIGVTTYIIQPSMNEALAGSTEQEWKDRNHDNWKSARDAMSLFMTESWLTDDMHKKASKIRDAWDKMQTDLSRMPIQEAANEEIYFDSLGSALDAAVDRTEAKGYTVDKDSLFFNLGTGGIKYETTKSASIPLEKGGKPQRKMLQISIYRMASGKYELTTYIN